MWKWPEEPVVHGMSAVQDSNKGAKATKSCQVSGSKTYTDNVWLARSLPVYWALDML